jgi:UDP-glucuronate decarboxylase
MMRTASDVVAADLEHISANADAEFSLMEGKNLLVVGGAGFLGYYLVQSILYRNAQVGTSPPIRVTVYDNYARGFPRWLAELSDDPNLSIVEHDITQPLPEDVPDFQYVMHGGSTASPIYYRQDPIGTMDAIVNGLRLLLDHAREQADRGRPMDGFLFFSSSEIYGDPDPDSIPTPEDYRGRVSCTGPRACYDEAKRFGETLCVNFAQRYGMPVKMVRPFNNIGPGLKITDRRVLPDFTRDILAGRDVVMLSDGSPRRTFCYVADAVIGYFKVLVRGHAGEPYNIGVDSPEISIAELADRLVELSRDLFGYTGSVVHRTPSDAAYLMDNPSRRCPAIAKARTHLGFDPTITLDEALRRSLLWYSENREAAEA